MHLKYFLFGGACLLSSLASYGQESTRCLVLLQTDGATVSFPLAEEPKITFNLGNWGFYDNMVVESVNELISFSMSDLDKLETQVITGVDMFKPNENQEIGIEKRDLIVYTSVSGIRYSIAEPNGRVIAAGELPEGLSKISLTDYQSGVYIITVGAKSIKAYIK